MKKNNILPLNPNELLDILNRLGSKIALCEHFKVSRSGLQSYEKRHNIKIKKLDTWAVEETIQNKID